MPFTIKRYVDENLCDVVPVLAIHILFGRPWQFDRRVEHDGFTNEYSFVHNQRKVMLCPMSPKQVHEDQLHLQKDHVQKKRVMKGKMRVKIRDGKKKEERKTNMYAKTSDIRRALDSKQPMIILRYKMTLLNTNVNDFLLSSVVLSLLQDYVDVFLEELPQRLLPIQGIEHQIDFIPSVTIPNRPAYRSNLEGMKELQKQVGELMEKGFIMENMSPCAVLRIMVLRKDGK